MLVDNFYLILFFFFFHNNWIKQYRNVSSKLYDGIIIFVWTNNSVNQSNIRSLSLNVENYSIDRFSDFNPNSNTPDFTRNYEGSSRGTIRKRDGGSRLLRGGRNLGEEVGPIVDRCESFVPSFFETAGFQRNHRTSSSSFLSPFPTNASRCRWKNGSLSMVTAVEIWEERQELSRRWDRGDLINVFTVKTWRETTS